MAVELRVLGPLEIVGDDGPIALPAPKHRRLLVALILANGRTCSSDALIDAIWGASPPASAPKLVQLYVSQLRAVLPSPSLLATRRPGYALDLDGCSTDALRFEELVADATMSLEQDNPALAASLAQRALELWRGEAYVDVAYDEFARAEADRLEELRLVAREVHLDARLRLGRHDALGEALALAEEHPLRERVQGLAMLALYRAGRQTEALDRYAALRARLGDELGLEVGPELRRLQRGILTHDPGLSVPATSEARARVPVAPNPILGRERELAELEQLLRRSDVRLVVLTGAGGSGKTRLALEVAVALERSFANGACFVDLAPVVDPGLVPEAIASALPLESERGRDPLGTAIEFLAGKELLLLVDNAEHVRPATTALVELLSSAPRLTILVTSRAVLHVSGEHVYPVQPLAEDAAAAMFVDRARQSGARIELDDAAESAIREICRRLDGLPLAIELAAARAPALAPGALLDRIDRRLPLLTGGPRDLPARQQTLRATLEWSHELLEPDARRAFAALGVFRSGFTVEVAEEVCGTDLDSLAALVDSHLLSPTVWGDPDGRLTMLETVRELAIERLDADPLLARRVSERHAGWIERVVASSHLTSTAALQATPWRVDPERVIALRDDIRAALDWATGALPEVAAAIAAGLEQYWVTHAPDEGRARIESLLALGEALPPGHRAALLRSLGSVAVVRGDIETGEQSYREALALFRDLENDAEVVSLLARFALHSVAEGDPERTRRLVVEVRALNESAGLPGVEAQCLSALSDLAEAEGDVEAAIDLERAAVDQARGCGFLLWQMWSLGWLSRRELTLGHHTAAAASAREALALAREFQDRRMMVSALAILAAASLHQGSFEAAGRIWGVLEGDDRLGAFLDADPDLADLVAALRDCAVPAFVHAVAQGRSVTLSEQVESVLHTETGSV
jgi:predicted ATPase/DNA-binding SARP family transcriptional activator